jgi:hypothetical protein
MKLLRSEDQASCSTFNSRVRPRKFMRLQDYHPNVVRQTVF